MLKIWGGTPGIMLGTRYILRSHLDVSFDTMSTAWRQAVDTIVSGGKGPHSREPWAGKLELISYQG